MCVRRCKATRLAAAREKRRPIDRQHRKASARRLQCPAQCGDRHRTRDGARARLLRPTVSAVASRIANLRHCSPVHALPSRAATTSPPCHRIQPRVRRRVWRLSRRPNQPGSGRVHIEEAQRRVPRAAVDSSGAVHLWPVRRAKVERRLVREKTAPTQQPHHHLTRRSGRVAPRSSELQPTPNPPCSPPPPDHCVRTAQDAARHPPQAAVPSAAQGRPTHLRTAASRPQAPLAHRPAARRQPSAQRRQPGAARTRPHVSSTRTESRCRSGATATAASTALGCAGRHAPHRRSRQTATNRSHDDHLVHHEYATRDKQLLAVVQRVAHEGRRVKTVGRDGNVALARRHTLEARVGVDVEQRILHERERSEADACLAEKHVGHVGEGISRTRALDDRKHTRSRAARAGAHLEHSNATAARQLRKQRRDGGHGALVVERADHSLLIHGKHCLHRATREQQLLVGDRT
eukprot:5268595-Prymnesium_polylepis.1